MIVGAGLAGLIAAHAFPRQPIVESRPEPTAAHKALLRFRSPAVGELVGVEFKPVTVRKGIWLDNHWEEPNIQVANMYASKTVGKVIDRSIWETESVTRWIAPEDLYERMLDSTYHRITWGEESDFSNGGEPVISTAPLPVALRAARISHGEQFDRAAITVQRFRIVSPTDVYQTVYFPTHWHSMYRASITGDLLICEFAGEPKGKWREDIITAFFVSIDHECEPLGEVEQKYGKIAPIDEGARKSLVARLTSDRNIFSLGRFATWRNILLDDVVHDVTVVKRLMTATNYDRKLRSI